MITYIESFIKKDTVIELQNFLKESSSWENLRKSESPPYMLELGYQDQEIARQIVASSMSASQESNLEKIATICVGYKLPKFSCSYMNFFKYETGAGLGIHSDVRPPGEIPDGTHFCSIILYINDDYSGGVFKSYEKGSSEPIMQIQPSAGSIVAMPNYVLHESTEIISGNKYIAVMHWYNRGA